MTLNNRKCPICRRPRVAEHAPFCSTRCRDRDLLQWLDEGYAIPASRPEPLPGEHDDDET
jgi:endogenous inhibitor of DNA gyrase (YacG/DUF329 family)